jgi:hypothetical protein
MPTQDLELDASGAVFRFFDPSAFVPTGQSTQNGGLFIPSRQDKEEAERRGTNVRLTVWDINKTTFEQAKRIWGKNVQTIAYGIAVVDVMKIREVCKNPRLRILSDPLPEEHGPGHDGHCGFEGLDRLLGEEKKAYKTLRDVLAQHAFELARL